MKSDCMTIYGRYRKAAGLTQERAAELLGVTVRSVAAWERGESVPPDMRVLAMADIYNAPTICIEHLRFNVAIARDVLPPVPHVALPQAVCQLCAALRKVADEHAEDQLLAIAADGRVDEMEERQFVELTEELDDVIAAALALRYAKKNYHPRTGRRAADRVRGHDRPARQGRAAARLQDLAEDHALRPRGRGGVSRVALRQGEGAAAQDPRPPPGAVPRRGE